MKRNRITLVILQMSSQQKTCGGRVEASSFQAAAKKLEGFRELHKRGGPRSLLSCVNLATDDKKCRIAVLASKDFSAKYCVMF